MAAHQPPAGAAGPAQPPHIVVPPILVGHPVTQQLFPLIQGGIILSPASDQDAIIVVQFTKTLRSWTATTPAEEVASYDLLHVVMSSRVAAQPGNNQPPLLGIANLQNQVAQIQARIGHLQADLTNKFEHIRARLLNMASSALSLPLIIVPMNGVPPPNANNLLSFRRLRRLTRAQLSQILQHYGIPFAGLTVAMQQRLCWLVVGGPRREVLAR